MVILPGRNVEGNLVLGNLICLVCTLRMSSIHTLGTTGRPSLSFTVLNLHGGYVGMYTNIIIYVEDDG